MITTVIFDLDDTLLDFHAAEHAALRIALPQCGVQPTAAMLDRYSVLNEQQWKLLEQGKLTRDEVKVRRFTLLFEEYGVCADAKETTARYERCLRDQHPLMAGALPLLTELARTYALYAATNGSTAVQQKRMREAGLTPFFKGVFISETIGADKPSAAFFAHCAAHIEGFDPASTVMVGDSLSSDIQGGKNAGIRTVWFNPRHRENRTAVQPDYTVNALADLPRLLSTL